MSIITRIFHFHQFSVYNLNRHIIINNYLWFHLVQNSGLPYCYCFSNFIHLINKYFFVLLLYFLRGLDIMWDHWIFLIFEQSINIYKWLILFSGEQPVYFIQQPTVCTVMYLVIADICNLLKNSASHYATVCVLIWGEVL